MIEIDAGAQGWITKTARRNYWRVCQWYELDDLIQDGVLYFYKIANRYPDVTNKAHLMRLFQVSYINYIHDLAKQKTRQPDARVSDLFANVVDEFTALDNIAPAQPEMSYLQVLIDEAPQAVRSVLKLLESDAGRQQLKSRYRIRENGHRETLNERLHRLTGIDLDIDLPHELTAYFQP